MNAGAELLDRGGAASIGPPRASDLWSQSIAFNSVTPLGAGVVAEPLPTGVWIRAAQESQASAQYRSWLYYNVARRLDLFRVVIGYPGAPVLQIGQVAEFCRLIPAALWPEVRFARFGPVARPPGEAVAFGQALADLVDQTAIVGTGVRIMWTDPDGGSREGAMLPDGAMTWTPFAIDYGYTPRSMTEGIPVDPVAVDAVAPIAGLAEERAGVFPLGDDTVLEVVRSGLWLRPERAPAGAAAIRAAAADPLNANLIYDTSTKSSTARMARLAAEVLQRLGEGTRAAFRLLPAHAFAKATVGAATARAAADDQGAQRAVHGTVRALEAAEVAEAVGVAGVAVRSEEPPAIEEADTRAAFGLPGPARSESGQTAVAGYVGETPAEGAGPGDRPDGIRAAAVPTGGPAAGPAAGPTHAGVPAQATAAATSAASADGGAAGSDVGPTRTDDHPQRRPPQTPLALLRLESAMPASVALPRLTGDPAAPKPRRPQDTDSSAPGVSTPRSLSPRGPEPGSAPVPGPGPGQQTEPLRQPEAARPNPDSPRAQTAPTPQASAIPTDRGLVAEHAWFRRSLPERYDAEAGSISRLLAETPGLRSGAGDTVEQVITELVAARLYLAGNTRAFDDTVRSNTVGPHVPMARCIMSGLRRLPSYRGATRICATLRPDERQWYADRQTVSEWSFCPALAGGRLRPPGTTEVLIWSVTARRTALLDPDLPDQVVFLPGTSFSVLRVEEGEHPRILLRELAAGEERAATSGPGDRATASRKVLEEMALRGLEQTSEAWQESPDGPGPRASAAFATGRFAAPPGLIVGLAPPTTDRHQSR